jgi:hypothetical protein
MPEQTGPVLPPQQPGWPVAPVSKPNAYWPLTIISALCFLLVGAIGIYFSSEVNSRWARGGAVGAEKASKTALWLGIVGIVVGLLAIIALASSSGSDYSSY